MTTKYTHTLTVAVPESLLEIGNQLAVYLGENPEADVNTFVNLTHERDGVKYAIAHTVMTESAKETCDSMDAPEGILVAIDVDLEGQLSEWGLSEITDTDLTDAA